ncbi:DUF305 domain-containing protein [Planctomonas psychrotolerans]|uniref:DUF305 domain-containing protein n=1 Tax=Planctomonas psychrotolerans TaxID=2528712 RepID=UPI001238DCD6|nr:DUF305 domain-containing protein [Planctomonas psychrotolerans]
MKNSSVTLGGLALAAALALSGCAPAGEPTSGGSDSAPAAEDVATSFNDTDVMFAQMMIPHHSQAIEMSDMILAKDDISTDVTDLATQIADAQGPEIDQLTAWLDEWEAEPLDGMGDMHHPMEGMMSNNQMARLDAATGAEAERLFLENMIIHHEGAIDMAETEVDGGENADAIALANEMITSQQAEIDTMQELLTTR